MRISNIYYMLSLICAIFIYYKINTSFEVILEAILYTLFLLLYFVRLYIEDALYKDELISHNKNVNNYFKAVKSHKFKKLDVGYYQYKTDYYQCKICNCKCMRYRSIFYKYYIIDDEFYNYITIHLYNFNDFIIYNYKNYISLVNLTCEEQQCKDILL